MAGSSQTTTDREAIRRWAEERGGRPASVRDTGGKGGPGVLRIDFEEQEPDDRLEPIDWDQFFEKFEEAGLAFLYQDTLKSGKQSRFFKFVQREGTNRDMGGRGKRGSRGTGSADEGEDGAGRDAAPKKSARSRTAEPKAEAGGDAAGEKPARSTRKKADDGDGAARATEGDAPKRTTTTRRKQAADGDADDKSRGRSGSSQTTADHDEIRRWVEARQGHPARVRDTGGKNDAGLLRIDFDEREPDERDARLVWIEWDEFFQKFEEAGLAFLYQETLKSGKESRFFKFVQR